MVSKLTKTRQLKKLKEIRRLSTQRNLAVAKANLVEKETLLNAANASLKIIRDEANETRMKRLSAIFAAEKDHGIHQALAINTYFQTDEEIETAKRAVDGAAELVMDAEQRVKSVQYELARKMLQEEKAERLCLSVIHEMRMEAARQS